MPEWLHKDPLFGTEQPRISAVTSSALIFPVVWSQSFVRLFPVVTVSDVLPDAAAASFISFRFPR